MEGEKIQMKERLSVTEPEQRLGPSRVNQWLTKTDSAKLTKAVILNGAEKSRSVSVKQAKYIPM